MNQARRGRPRDAQVDERVLRTAAGLLLERGYNGLSIDEVAERAGVAKTTLYRRWPTKDHLAVAVVARLQDDDGIDDTGDIRRDLTDYMEKIADALNRMRSAGRTAGRDDRSAGVVAELVAAGARHDDIGEMGRQVYARRNALALGLIERARLRGELRADLDAAVLLDQLAGALYYRVLVTGAPVDRAYAERLVAAALDGAMNRKEIPPCP
ncbi:TetR family transcriptional regulator [Planomonospora parontospora subsp. parontospora]|uniref:TetR family transcriptional regulator n=3 Tax=Planomonospora parontospora TaxID=58119 RepID=A0AA37F1Y9_9ACTN|nr:TetR family transcriptional regulator [Planomonospora parontospora]GII06300.1 TetR family transcriptional regulator [Planomonospora parontospora subsp. parontospora]